MPPIKTPKLSSLRDALIYSGYNKEVQESYGPIIERSNAEQIRRWEERQKVQKADAK